MSAEPVDLKAVELLMAVQEAIDLPHAATVGDGEVRRVALEERAAQATITLERVLDPDSGPGVVWEARNLRERLAALPARPYTTWEQAYGQPRPRPGRRAIVTAPGVFADPFPPEFEARVARRPVGLATPCPNGIPAPRGACPTCTYAPCACSRTDEALDLILEAEALGLYDAGIGEPEQ